MRHQGKGLAPALLISALLGGSSVSAAASADEIARTAPGGHLVVIDVPPTIWRSPWTTDGLPANRGGHGIPAQVLSDELTQKGFEAVSLDEHCSNGWLGRHYFAAVFRKPMPAGALPSDQEGTPS